MVRDVSDAHVEEGKIGGHEILMNDLEFFGLDFCMESFVELDNHTRVDFDSDDLLRSFKEQVSQVTGTGTDFEYDIGGSDS